MAHRRLCLIDRFPDLSRAVLPVLLAARVRLITISGLSRLRAAGSPLTSSRAGRLWG